MLALSSLSFSPLSPLFPPSTSLRLPSSSTKLNSIRASMERTNPDFPYIPPANRALMIDLLAAFNSRLQSALLPSAVSPDALRFQNSQGSAHGYLDIRSGSQTSTVDLLLQSSLNCKTPGGGEISIATIIAFLKSSNDAPHFMIDLIQGSPTSLVLLMDLLPRKDLVTHPDYLDEFYQLTDLDGPRRRLESLPQVSPYRSPSLFIRSMLSPTAIAVTVDAANKIEIEEIVSAHIGSAAKEIVGIWLEKCAGAVGGVVAEGERAELGRRDALLKRKAVEIDLAANLPRMFGPEVAERVVAEIQKAFGV